MATILSTPTTMTVIAPGTPALGPLAASMAPGTWAQLTVSNQNAVLADTGASGTPLHYCNSMPWNPVSKCIEIVAGDHHGATPSMRHLRYLDATNGFSEPQASPVVPGIGHGYDHNTVNPTTGDLYHRLYNSQSVARKALGASSFSNIPDWNAGGWIQVAIGSCWWSGSFAGGGAQGSLIIFNSGNAVNAPTDGQITAYNPLTNAWFFNQSSMAPNYGSGSTYHSVIEYSSVKNVAVYGGGNAAPNKLWRLNSDRTFTVMPDVPTGKAVGMQRGIICADPITGNFLLLSAGELWELNPSGSGTWTRQTGTRVPPAGVGIPGPTNPQPVICSSIDDYGVVAYITQPSQTGGTFFLYKHA